MFLIGADTISEIYVTGRGLKSTTNYVVNHLAKPAECQGTSSLEVDATSKI